MTRINTNVSSLNAQKTLARSNDQLQESLTRLSTGLRINSGKDDPAGLIASETLRSDIVSTEVAISNSERANQMIATADSALGQVSSLLNDIRGLVSEAANVGAMSSEQIAANQLQVDSSLEAIDRIAQVTQFQGKRLLDGSLDFITQDIDSSQISGLHIDQANFGSQPEVGVNVSVVAQAEKAALSYGSATVSNDVVLEIGGSNGFEAFNFASGSTIEDMASAINLVSDSLGITATVTHDTAAADTTGHVTLSSVGENNDIVVTAKDAGSDAGNIDIIYSLDDASTGSVSGASATVNTNTDGSTSINVALEVSQWLEMSAVDSDLGGDGRVTITAQAAGSQYNGVNLKIIDTADGNSATYDHENNLITVTVDITGSAHDASDVAQAITDDLGHIFSATAGTDDTVVAGTYDLSDPAVSTYTEGVDGGNILATADDVIAALIATTGDNPGALVEADTATGNDGSTEVTMFTERGYFGTQNTGSDSDLDNYLQFLGPDGMSDMNVRFVNNGANQELSIDLVGNTATNGKATTVVQSDADNASFTVTANFAGEAYNDVTVVFDDSTADDPPLVTWDPEAGTLTITGNLEDGMSAATIVEAINNDAVVGHYFTADIFGSGDGTGDVNAPSAGGTAEMATLAGGNEYTGVTINLATDADGEITTTAAELVALVEAGGTGLDDIGMTVTNAGTSDGSGTLTTGSVTFASENVTTTDDYADVTTNNAAGENAQMTITAKTAGAAYDGVKVNFINDDDVTFGTDEYLVYNSDTKELNIYIDSGNTSVNNIIARLNDTGNAAVAALFSFAAVGTGDGAIVASDIGGTTTGGVAESGTAAGVHMLDNYDEGDELSSTSLTFTSAEYGSDAFVSVKALEGTFACVDSDGTTKTRDNGADVDVRINGIQAVSDGLGVSLNTSALDMSFTVGATVAAGSELEFTITDGGAQFQLGPDVVSTQQARLGIQSINTAKLGGTSGQLFQLRSGGDYDLDTNTMMAARVVEEAITSVTTLRGRLGAFQSTTVQSNIDVLNDTLEGLTEAESSIRDADFAEESANLTRAQILVQSGVSVLSMANQNPQNVLSLLR